MNLTKNECEKSFPGITRPDTRKNVYRNGAKIHHPDKGGDPEKFRLIQTCYENFDPVNTNIRNNLYKDKDWDNVNIIDKISMHYTNFLYINASIFIRFMFFFGEPILNFIEKFSPDLAKQLKSAFGFLTLFIGSPTYLWYVHKFIYLLMTQFFKLPFDISEKGAYEAIQESTHTLIQKTSNEFKQFVKTIFGVYSGVYLQKKRNRLRSRKSVTKRWKKGRGRSRRRSYRA